MPPRSELPYTAGVQTAYKEAMDSRGEFAGVVGTGQLLYAMLDPKDVAGALILQAGITKDEIRSVLRELYTTDEYSFRSDSWLSSSRQ